MLLILEYQILVFVLFALSPPEEKNGCSPRHSCTDENLPVSPV